MEFEKIRLNCPNNIRVNIKKDGSQQLFDEDCCTVVSLVLRNNGELATSFYGALSPHILNTLETEQKKYFDQLRQQMRVPRMEFIEEDEDDDIEVSSDDIPEDDKWSDED